MRPEPCWFRERLWNSRQIMTGPCFCEDHGKSYCQECGFAGEPWDDLPRIGRRIWERRPAECKHGLFPWICSECGGPGECKHGYASCEECGYTDQCIHKRRRYYCVECKGGGICEHSRRKSVCKECKRPAPVLSEANLEAHDFRLEFAASVMRSFPQKRKLGE